MKFTKEKYRQIDLQLIKAVENGLTIAEISKLIGISKSTVNRRLRALNIGVPNYHNTLKFDNTVFDTIDSEEKAYWLGFLYADGYVSSDKNIISVTLKVTDCEHLEKLRRFFKATLHKVTYGVTTLNGRHYGKCSLQVCDKHLKGQLVNLGCPPKKSLILKFPDISVFTESSLVYPFIRGYIDGDGCLTFSKNGRLELSILGTENFLSGIQKVFPNRFKSIHHIKRTKSDICKISVIGDNADFISTILYQNASIYLQRKFNRFAVLSRNV